jgi:hypothetical protein
MKLLLFLLFLPSITLAAHDHKEKEYQDAWCKKVQGVTEYRLEDGARVDCLADKYAVEFDFAPKWAEAVGQALYYAEMTGRKPAIVLIEEYEGDEHYMDRLEKVAGRYGIQVWPMTSDEL